MTSIKSVLVVSSVVGFLLGALMAAWWDAGPEDVR